jgi:hypothetical protein
MRACPNASDAHLVLLRYEQRKKWEVDDFGELMSGKLSAFGYKSCRLWVWSLEMVQRCRGYTYEQGGLRGRVGKERGGKEMDRCHLTVGAWASWEGGGIHGVGSEGGYCKGITQTLIPDTLAVKPKASQSTDGNLLWSVVYISDIACLHVGTADDTQPALADDTPLAPSPRVDRSRPNRSDVYRSSTQNADATILHTCKVDDISLHSYRSNARRSQSVLPIIVYTLVLYATYLSLIIFRIIPHPMTLLTTIPLQVIILHFI